MRVNIIFRVSYEQIVRALRRGNHKNGLIAKFQP